MEATKYPLDFDTLRKGDVFTREQLEQIIGAKAGEPKFGFGALGLAKLIEREMSARGEIVTCRMQDYELHILPDLEASSYNAKAFNAKLGGLFTCFRRLLGVNDSKFNAEQKRIHGRRCETQGKVMQALSSVTRRELPTNAYKRIAPGRSSQAAG